MSLSRFPFYTVPGVYKKSEAAGGAKFRVVIENGKMTIETIANPSSPGSCDKARTLLERSLDLEDSVESASSRHPVEEQMMAPPVAEPEIETEKEIEKF